MPSPTAVLVFMFAALAGWCSLQQAELQAVREENRILAGRSEELDQLKVEMRTLRRGEFASIRREFGGL
jgi:hypothetical protein